jgi:hypothetical protein
VPDKIAGTLTHLDSEVAKSRSEQLGAMNEYIRKAVVVAENQHRSMRAQAFRNFLAHQGTLGETLNSVSSVSPTHQRTSIKDLEPIFKQFTNTEVAVYAMDNLPIGPRAGIESVPESTLKAIASVEVQRRGRLSDRSCTSPAADSRL